MGLDKPKIKRRRYFLPGTSQPRMLFGILFILVYVSVVLTVSLYISTHPNLPENYEQAQAMIRNIQALMFPILVLINLVGILVSVALLLLFTHRIAGPVYSLGRILGSIAEGDLSQEIRFRKSDYLQEIAREGNAAVEHLRQEIAAAQHLLENIRSCLDEAPGGYSQAASDCQLEELVQQLQDRLGAFKVD
jgi:nitrogen fixation/metabolism regulation signal transduction histidine kinase